MQCREIGHYSTTSSARPSSVSGKTGSVSQEAAHHYACGGGGISSTQERGFERRHCVNGAEEQFGEGARQASLLMEAFHVSQGLAHGPESIVHHLPLVGSERRDQVILCAIHGAQRLPQCCRVAQSGVGADSAIRRHVMK